MLTTEAIQDFIRYIQYEKRLAKHSVVAYQEDLKDWMAYHAATFQLHNVEEIQLIHLRSYLIILINEMKLKPASIKRKVSSLNGLFKYLQLQGILAKNPAKLLQVPKLPERLPQYLDDQQAASIPNIVAQTNMEEEGAWDQYTHQLILNLLYQTGMRRSELLHLKKSSIDPIRKELRVLGKGNKERIIPISSSMVSSLENYIKIKEIEFGIYTENILTLKSGKPVSISYIYRVVKKYLSALTTLKKKSPHVLRHTFASQLLNNGADLSAIQKLLGHQSLAATQVYTHVNIEQLKDVYRKAHPKSTDE